MKRSKVLDIIAAWGKPEILQDVYSNNYQEWADNLLHTLETELGMLPPYKNEEEPFGYNEGYIKAPSWEPEKECNIPEFAFKCLNCHCEESNEKK